MNNLLKGNVKHLIAFLCAIQTLIGFYNFNIFKMFVWGLVCIIISADGFLEDMLFLIESSILYRVLIVIFGRMELGLPGEYTVRILEQHRTNSRCTKFVHDYEPETRVNYVIELLQFAGRHAFPIIYRGVLYGRPTSELAIMIEPFHCSIVTYEIVSSIDVRYLSLPNYPLYAFKHAEKNFGKVRVGEFRGMNRLQSSRVDRLGDELCVTGCFAGIVDFREPDFETETECLETIMRNFQLTLRGNCEGTNLYNFLKNWRMPLSWGFGVRRESEVVLFSAMRRVKHFVIIDEEHVYYMYCPVKLMANEQCLYINDVNVGAKKNKNNNINIIKGSAPAKPALKAPPKNNKNKDPNFLLKAEVEKLKLLKEKEKLTAVPPPVVKPDTEGVGRIELSSRRVFTWHLIVVWILSLGICLDFGYEWYIWVAGWIYCTNLCGDRDPFESLLVLFIYPTSIGAYVFGTLVNVYYGVIYSVVWVIVLHVVKPEQRSYLQGLTTEVIEENVDMRHDVVKIGTFNKYRVLQCIEIHTGDNVKSVVIDVETLSQLLSMAVCRLDDSLETVKARMIRSVASNTTINKDRFAIGSSCIDSDTIMVALMITKAQRRLRNNIFSSDLVN